MKDDIAFECTQKCGKYKVGDIVNVADSYIRRKIEEGSFKIIKKEETKVEKPKMQKKMLDGYENKESN